MLSFWRMLCIVDEGRDRRAQLCRRSFGIADEGTDGAFVVAIGGLQCPHGDEIPVSVRAVCTLRSTSKYKVYLYGTSVRVCTLVYVV